MGKERFITNHYRPFLREAFSSYLPQELPSRIILERYKSDERWFLNPKQTYGTHHDIGHLTRVLIMQELIANKIQEENPQLQLDREALRWTAAMHDVRKTGEYELNFRQHGIRAAEWVKEYFAQEHPEIPTETIAKIIYINYNYHNRRMSKIQQEHLQELRILQDADNLDILRVVHMRIPIIANMPTFVRDAAFAHFYLSMHFDPSRQLFIFAEQLGILSMHEQNSYRKDPFNSVMNAAGELGLLKA